MNRSCFCNDEIIKIFTEIRSDMHSSPAQEDQKRFMHQGLVCRGGMPLFWLIIEIHGDPNE